MYLLVINYLRILITIDVPRWTYLSRINVFVYKINLLNFNMLLKSDIEIEWKK